MKIINRFGEIYYDKNEALVTMPFNRLEIEEVELLEENYRNKIKEIDYPDSLIYTNHLSSIRDRVQISFDLDGCVDFHNIQKYKLKDMLPYLYSMIDLARQDVNILWQKSNMIIDMTEQRVKALVFEFNGFKIYKKDNSVDGLKELILLALTKNNNIIAKPKRADFIEKTNEVFQFSDDIVASNTIDEIESVIQAYDREIEYQQLKAEKEKEEKKENSKIFALKEKIKPNKKEKNPDEELKEKLQEEMSTKDKKDKGSGNLLDKLTTPVSMLSILGVLLVFGILFTVTDLSSGATTKEDEIQKQLSQKDEILEAYRLYISGDADQKEQAYAKLDSIGYDSLPKKDKSTLIDWYIQQEQYTKAITIEPESAYQISGVISTGEEDKESAKTDLETLETSFPDSKVIKFDIASLDENYQGMVENSKLVKYNEKRDRKSVKAYVLTNQIDELDNLIDEYQEDEVSYEILQEHYDQYVDKYSEKKELNDKLEELKAELKDRKSTRLNSSHVAISYAVFCL